LIQPTDGLLQIHAPEDKLWQCKSHQIAIREMVNPTIQIIFRPHQHQHHLPCANNRLISRIAGLSLLLWERKMSNSWATPASRRHYWLEIKK